MITTDLLPDCSSNVWFMTLHHSFSCQYMYFAMFTLDFGFAWPNGSVKYWTLFVKWTCSVFVWFVCLSAYPAIGPKFSPRVVPVYWYLCLKFTEESHDCLPVYLHPHPDFIPATKKANTYQTCSCDYLYLDFTFSPVLSSSVYLLIQH